GFGFRVGFLGLLHMEIIQERLEREYGLTLVTTAPNVVYRVNLQDGRVLELENPALMPSANQVGSIAEPYVTARIIVPGTYVGAIMELCQDRRGIFKNMEYLDTTRALLTYEM